MTLPGTPHPDAQPPAAYETSDVNIRAVLGFALGIAIGAVIVAVGLWILLSSLRAEAQRSQPALSPLAGTPPSPPAPRLQSAPTRDYQELRKQEDELLHSSGWIDREHNIVRIPIERAMELIVERGEPVVHAQQKQPAVTTVPAANRDSPR